MPAVTFEEIRAGAIQRDRAHQQVPYRRSRLRIQRLAGCQPRDLRDLRIALGRSLVLQHPARVVFVEGRPFRAPAEGKHPVAPLQVADPRAGVGTLCPLPDDTQARFVRE